MTQFTLLVFLLGLFSLLVSSLECLSQRMLPYVEL